MLVMAGQGRRGGAETGMVMRELAWSCRRVVARSGSVSRAAAGSVWLRAARRSGVGSSAVVCGLQGVDHSGIVQQGKVPQARQGRASGGGVGRSGDGKARQARQGEPNQRLAWQAKLRRCSG